MTARDTLVALLGEAKADQVIEQAARAEYASDRMTDEDWDREGRDLYLTPVTAALAAVLPDLLASASEQAAEVAAQRDALLAIIDDARHSLWAPGAKVEPTRQVLARAAAAIADWQQRRLRARDVTPTATAVHLHSLLDQERAETARLRALLPDLTYETETTAMGDPLPSYTLARACPEHQEDQ